MTANFAAFVYGVSLLAWIFWLVAGWIWAELI